MSGRSEQRIFLLAAGKCWLKNAGAGREARDACFAHQTVKVKVTPFPAMVSCSRHRHPSRRSSCQSIRGFIARESGNACGGSKATSHSFDFRRQYLTNDERRNTDLRQHHTNPLVDPFRLGLISFSLCNRSEEPKENSVLRFCAPEWLRRLIGRRAWQALRRPHNQ